MEFLWVFKAMIKQNFIEVISHIITGIDLYLIGIVLLIFGLGIYELFISKIDPDEREDSDTGVLEIKSLENLKDKLLKAIIMVLVVTFFKQILSIKVESTQDLLYSGISILLIATSGYLMHYSSSDHH
ncbi:YqhA family protein [Neosynechococcus sphagnicola]|uniref:YqhA family protein n=1 Tax=Neosynechococcus sphagnicola TaxID=1501145 RepID=UPI0006901F9D|nr:YqhA family protein [Neosynechococcus sphagnicola]